MNIIILILLLLFPISVNAEYLGCYEPSETVYATVQFNDTTGDVAATSVSARVYDPNDTTTPTATPAMSAIDGTNAIGLFRGSFSVGATPLQGTWTIRYNGTIDANVWAGTDTFDVMDVAGECATRGSVTIQDGTGTGQIDTNAGAIVSVNTLAANAITSTVIQDWAITATKITKTLCDITASTNGYSFTVAACTDAQDRSVTIAANKFVGNIIEAYTNGGTTCNVNGQSGQVIAMSAGGVITLQNVTPPNQAFTAAPNTTNCGVAVR